MIFDLGRCIYDALTWDIEGYWFNDEKITPEEYENKYGKPDLNHMYSREEYLSHTCNKYVILSMHTLKEKVEIKYFDNDIDEVFKNIRAACLAKSDYVNLSKIDFYNKSDSYGIDCYNSGHISIYQ